MNNNELEDIAKNLIKTTELAGKKSIEIQEQGLKIITKPDNSPVTNGDLEVNKMITEKIKNLTPNFPIISEETVDLKTKNRNKTFWLIDPIYGTMDYIKNKDEYTLNAALIIDLNPALGIVNAPRKNRLFYSYGIGLAFEIQNGKKKNLNCKKLNADKIIALVNSDKITSEIEDIYKNYKVSQTIKMSSSLKFCTLAAGEADIYAAKARAFEWDIAAGHAILTHAGGEVRTHEGKNFLYGKENYKNLPIIAKRSKDLDN